MGMNDYVNLVEALKGKVRCYYHDELDTVVGDAVPVDYIRRLPVVTANPVKGGQWVESNGKIICPNCKEEFSDEIIYMTIPEKN